MQVNRPSFQLRVITWIMRMFLRPRMQWIGTPNRARREFELLAPFLFRAAKGLKSEDVGSMVRHTVGEVAQDRAVLYMHGGGFMMGSPRSYRAMAGAVSQYFGMPVYLVRYPLVQEQGYPAAPDAVLAAWDQLMQMGWRPEQIVLAGDSAGGNLTMGLLSRLLARGISPRAVVAFSPWLDMSLSGDSIASLAEREALIPVNRMEEAVERYLNGVSTVDPLVSPLFADYPNAPPMLLQVGSEEILRSDSERFAQRTDAHLQIWPDCPHCWQLFHSRIPEARAALSFAGEFVSMCFEEDPILSEDRLHQPSAVWKRPADPAELQSAFQAR